MLNIRIFLYLLISVLGSLFFWASSYAEPASVRPVVHVQVEPHLEDLVQLAIAPIVHSAQVSDEGDAWQLFRRLRPAIREALNTKGYFAAEVSRAPDSANNPLAVDLVVRLGPQFRIQEVDVLFEGAVGQPEFDQRRADLKSQWGLKQGAVFDQEVWGTSKDNVLRDLMGKDFAAARLADSQALVDPETQSVSLRVVYDSGPVFTFGELDIEGLKKFRSDLVSRYNTIKPGDRYEQEKLLALQAELQNTTYFSSVDVKVDVDDQSPSQVPIHVKVTESNTKRLSFGGGYSSNTGFRSEASYQFNNLFDRAYALSTGARLEQKRQSAYADLFLPPSRKGMVDSVGVAMDHQAVSNLVVERTSFGAVRQYTQGANDVRLGLNFQVEDRHADGASFGSTQALVASAAWTHDRLDDRLNPRQGYVTFAQVAGASQALASSQDFLRLYGRAQYFWSPTKVDVFSTRWELGTVLASAQRDVPQDYLFRAGGSNSVRGFNFMDLGVRDQGVLVGGRRVLVGSLEYTRWLQGNLGAAVFSDWGAVADVWRDVNPQASVGLGVRYKTPAGALALDVAKAFAEPRPRIHFSFGVEF
jgi:translocation and assembly module TamA